MSDLMNEQRLTIRELAALEKVDLSTVWRWAKHGVRGTVLATYAVGGRRYTTREAYQRFADGCTQASLDVNQRQKRSTQ